jgi:hypothetical protein
LNEKSLFGALVVALSNPVSYLTYDKIVAREFQPKQQKKINGHQQKLQYS